MAEPQIRKPRFDRAPTGGIVITDRDVNLLGHVHRYRFLRSTHLIALTGRSRQALLRRLALLFHHGYLDRPVMQLDFYARGSEPLVYALGQRGAKILQAKGGRRLGGVRWDTKNRNVSRVFLHHALAVAEVMVAFETACRRTGGVELLRQEAIVAGLPERTRQLRLPLRWRVEVTWQGKLQILGLEPDRVFGLRLAGSPAGRDRAYFFLEADRGTMPVRRKGLAQSSILRKLLAYEATWRQGLHRGHLGLSNFRVLTVTTNQERLTHLVEACRAIGGSAGLFLFADYEGLLASNILTRVWVNGRGEEVRLLSDRLSSQAVANAAGIAA